MPPRRVSVGKGAHPAPWRGALEGPAIGRVTAMVPLAFLSPVADARRRRNPAAGRWTLPAGEHIRRFAPCL